MDEPEAATLVERYRRAKARRATWEAHWQECYDFALPQRDTVTRDSVPGEKKTEKLYDGTAPDAVDQLAASLLSELTPPWTRWFGLAAGIDVAEGARAELGQDLDHSAEIIQSHLQRSNFAVEMHQCYLDLVTVGTASLLFEESPPGERTAFRFTAVPLSQVVFEENAFGDLDTTFRRSELAPSQYKERFPRAALPDGLDSIHTANDADRKIAVIEAVVPEKGGFAYTALLEGYAATAGGVRILRKGRFNQSPYINFRWLKAPGEIYGRSPVMKCLPDIKTANKVVELVLKNASIAVTGIWQADDDGVLNPATIKLIPGTIIPKAVGSQGLTPLAAPGRFDTSELVLDKLRDRIRHALLADRLGEVRSPRMSATEVVQRTAEMNRILGATYGRLQSALLTPLVLRAVAVLARRGAIPPVIVDGHRVELEYKSPLARQQAQIEVESTLRWLDTVRNLGPEALNTIDSDRTARWLARVLGVPPEILRDQDPPVDVSLPDPQGVMGDPGMPADGISPENLFANVPKVFGVGSQATAPTFDPGGTDVTA